jgi:hypothetical protein
MPKCMRCGKERPRDYVLCQDCWWAAPKVLKRQWYDAANRQAKIRAANAIYRWVGTQQTKFPLGLSYDAATDSVHFDVVEFLRLQGLPPTEANKDAAMKQWREVCAEEFPGVPETVIINADLNPEA